jgi:hypothetical protein
MAQKRQTPLSTKEKLSLAQKAKQTERLGDIAKLVDANLATKPTECWRTLTMEHKEIVLFRLAAGDTVKHVADKLVSVLVSSIWLATWMSSSARIMSWPDVLALRL